MDTSLKQSWSKFTPAEHELDSNNCDSFLHTQVFRYTYTDEKTTQILSIRYVSQERSVSNRVRSTKETKSFRAVNISDAWKFRTVFIFGQILSELQSSGIHLSNVRAPWLTEWYALFPLRTFSMAGRSTTMSLMSTHRKISQQWTRVQCTSGRQNQILEILWTDRWSPAQAVFGQDRPVWICHQIMFIGKRKLLHRNLEILL